MKLQGESFSDILRELKARKSKDPDLNSAQLFGLVYPTGRDDIETLVSEVSQMYLFENALNPFKFPELAHLEEEVIDSVSNLLNRKETSRRGGAMTSGGTESILMSMSVHKARAVARGVKSPKIVAATSAHPAYAKAASYFGLELVQVPLDKFYRADLDTLRNVVTDETAVVVASAFCYPYGIMDQVEEIASIAQSSGAGCHVDACIGGFVLPFLEKLGRDVPLFDFRVPGVTAISADIHKYGYVPKGASVLLHRDDD
ncbi:MAG: aspartate aminotransferase family protein, partial [Acidimicrobiales bacterium]|nr:aspartate aminotransferase family protein [Acidimicrobiales bacterium]